MEYRVEVGGLTLYLTERQVRELHRELGEMLGGGSPAQPLVTRIDPSPALLTGTAEPIQYSQW